MDKKNLRNQKLIPVKQKVIQIANWYFNPIARVISKNNSKIKLTDIEFSLLQLLLENAGKELSRIVILKNIWGYTPERYTDTRLIDVYISKLRLKIEENSRNPDLILTVRGVGYMFQSIIPKD